MTNKIDAQNLTGKCLISMPDITGNFAETVVYICSHNTDGAMGFIVNKRIKEFSFSDLSIELPFEIKNNYTPINLYQGGPLEKNKGFILHSDDYTKSDSLNTGGGIMVSSSLEILRDIASGNGPKQRIIALGYAGWAPNQLENEIANNLWLITHAAPELVLGSNDTIKWSQAMSSLGIRFDNLTPSFGHS